MEETRAVEGVAWEDLAVLLAVVREGSVNRAATTLRIGQSTASRRLVRLESRIGGQVFDRTPEGMRPTALALQLLPHAELVEQHMADIERVILLQEAEPSGRLKVALPDGLASTWLIPRIAPFLARYAQIEIDFVIGHAVVDLVRREADVAVRFVRPTSGDLIAQRLGNLPLAPYAHPRVLETPRESWRWVVFDDPHHRYVESQWVETHAHPRRTMRVSLWNALFGAALEGIGPAILSPIVAEPAGLVRVPFEVEVPDRDLYLVVHRALRRVPRVRVFREWLLEHATAFLSYSTDATSTR